MMPKVARKKLANESYLLWKRLPQVTNVHFFGDVRRRKVNNDSLLAAGKWRLDSFENEFLDLLLSELFRDVDVDETGPGSFTLTPNL